MKRTQDAERADYIRQFQQSLATVSNAVVRLRPVGASPATYSADAGTAGMVRVRSRGGHLLLRIAERFQVATVPQRAGEWVATKVAYQYQVHTNTGDEILAFHWHPEPARPDRPHLHLSPGAGALRGELHRAHVPTGVLSLQEFLEFVIRDFGVRPQRTEWASILAQNP